MKFSRDELAMIQSALHVHAASEVASAPSWEAGAVKDRAREVLRIKQLRDKIQSHLLSDAPPETQRSPQGYPASVSD